MVIAAIVAGTVVSAVAGTAGAVVGAKKADAARADARKAADQQKEAADAQLDFQKEQYEDWQSVYGPVRENLASFYQGLTPETFIASGLAQINKQYEATQDQFERQFAQRGIDSAAQDMMQQQASLGAGRAKAELRHGAPLQLAAAEQGFLAGNVVNPGATGIASAYGSQVNMYGQQVTNAQNREAQSTSDMWGSISGIGSAISSGITAGVGAGAFGGVSLPSGSSVTGIGLPAPTMEYGNSSNTAIANAVSYTPRG